MAGGAGRRNALSVALLVATTAAACSRKADAPDVAVVEAGAVESPAVAEATADVASEPEAVEEASRPEASEPRKVAQWKADLQAAAGLVERVEEEKALFDEFVALYPNLISTGDGLDRPLEAGMLPAERKEPSVPVRAQLAELRRLQEANAPPEQIRPAASEVLKALRSPDIEPTDLPRCRGPLTEVFREVQRELLRVAGGDEGLRAVPGLFHRAALAAAKLAALGEAGAGDALVLQTIRVSRFKHRYPSGFRITSDRWFPPPRSIGDLPLVEALAEWRRPIPEVGRHLLDLVVESPGPVDPDAVIAAQHIRRDAPTAHPDRRLAADAFVSLFEAVDTPEAAEMRERYRFLAEEAVPLTALERPDREGPTFQLWPPQAFAGTDAFGFATYRDALAACALAERPSDADGERTRAAAEDATYRYCFSLRFEPAFVKEGEPTLWGCYERYPWLRDREPIGPACSSVPHRILAAYLYVRMRSQAAVASEDGVTAETLAGIMSLRDLVRFARTLVDGEEPAPSDAFERLAAELAKVRLDFPVFVPPADEAARTAPETVPRPPDPPIDVPDVVPVPWHRHDDWTVREPRTFEGLRGQIDAEGGPARGNRPAWADDPAWESIVLIGLPGGNGL